MDEQRKFVAAVAGLDAAFRTGSVHEAIAEQRKAAMNELGGQHSEEVDGAENSGTS